MRIARQVRNEEGKKLFQIFRQGANDVLIASMTRWEEQFGPDSAGEALPGDQGESGAFE